MAVNLGDRRTSGIQFLDTAMQLEIFTIKTCVNFPKRYTFLLTNEIVRLAQSVYNNVKAANSIFPSGTQEMDIRREYLIRAYCDLQCLSSQIDIAREMFGARIQSDNGKSRKILWSEWLNLIETEMKLVAAVQKSDSKHLSKLTNGQ